MGAGQTFSYFLLAHIIRHQPTHDLRSTVYDHDGYLLERERDGGGGGGILVETLETLRAWS